MVYASSSGSGLLSCFDVALEMDEEVTLFLFGFILTKTLLKFMLK